MTFCNPSLASVKDIICDKKKYLGSQQERQSLLQLIETFAQQVYHLSDYEKINLQTGMCVYVLEKVSRGTTVIEHTQKLFYLYELLQFFEKNQLDFDLFKFEDAAAVCRDIKLIMKNMLDNSLEDYYSHCQ
jgi:hypothetical protein